LIEIDRNSFNVHLMIISVTTVVCNSTLKIQALCSSKTFNEPEIVNCIKVNGLARAGLVVHTNNDRALKKIFNTKPERVRSVQKPNSW
jgi:hypothetical protein